MNINNKTDLNQFKQLSSYGFSLIPLNGKKPIENKWQKWCSEIRPFNENDFKNRNAGICCGPASGIIVLDVDEVDFFKAIVDSNSFILPDTLVVRTGSGTFHNYYFYPNDNKEYRNRSLKHPIYPKNTIFDIRGIGGQVVAPGSIHPDTGIEYAIENEHPIAEFPSWLFDFYRGIDIDTSILYSFPLPEPYYMEFINSLNISDKSKELIINGKEKGERSEAIMTILNSLTKAKTEIKKIFYIFDHYAIGEKYREKGSSNRNWLHSQIERSNNFIKNGNHKKNTTTNLSCNDHERVVEDMNKNHAAIMIGGKFVIMNKFYDASLEHDDINFSNIQDFHNRYKNRKLNGTPISKIWLESPYREQYEGIGMFPNIKTPKGYYNLFQGFTTKPKEGEWGLFKNHILKIIANDDFSVFKYILYWLADLFQNTGGKRPGVVFTLRGKQGTGKGVFVSLIGDILGRHYLHISNQYQVTGKFNNHLKDALLIFCDEAIWAGNKSDEGALKSLITEDLIMIEPKGKDPFQMKNYIRMIIASNNDWVVPTGNSDRRFFVVDVSDKHKQDPIYFKAIIDQMNNGGREAMLHDLLNLDLTGIDLRNFPKTEARFDQMINTMQTIEKFWFEILNDGFIDEDFNEWKNEISTSNLYDEYIEFSKKMHDYHPFSNSKFGKEIKRLCPEIRKEKKSGSYRKRQNFYLLPSLEKCRRAFEEEFGQEIKWDI